MERVEEYLEAIYDIQQERRRIVKTSDLAKRLGIKPSSVTEMLMKLSERGYVEYQPYYGVVLTDQGLGVAKRIKKFHKIFETFFTDFLGLDGEEAHKLSCELEHHVTDEVADRVCMLISSLDCSACTECDRSFYLLKNAPDGLHEIVVAPTIVKEIGFLPGRVVKKSGEHIYVDGEGFHLTDDVASKIVVKSLDAQEFG